MSLIAGLRHWTTTHYGQMAVQFIKFGMVGVVGLVVDVAVLYLVMAASGLNPYLARVVSFLFAATATWALNRVFTFRGRHQDGLLRQWAKFISSNAVGGLVNYATFALLVANTETVAQHPFLGVAAGSIAGMMLNFFAARTVVFRPAPDAMPADPP